MTVTEERVLILKAVDEMSKTVNQIKTRMDETKKSVTDLTDRFRQVQRTFRDIIAPALAAYMAVQKIARIVSDLTSSYEEQYIAESKLTSALKATGGAIGLSERTLKDYAEELDSATNFTDEMLLAAEGVMLTFTKIGKDIFPEAIERAADMSEMFGQDLKSSVIQLGKALNDPIRGVSALAEIGVSFTTQQREQIRVLQESNDMLGAQRVILDELNAEFGGAARGAATGAIGAVRAFTEAMTDLKQAGGEAIITFFAPGLRAAAEWVQTLAEGIELANEVRRLTSAEGMQQTLVSASEIESAIETLRKQRDELQDVYEKSLTVQGESPWQKAWDAFLKSMRGVLNIGPGTYLAEIQTLNAAIKTYEAALEGARAQETAIGAEKAKQTAEAERQAKWVADAAERAEAYKQTDEGRLALMEADLALWEAKYRAALAVDIETAKITEAQRTEYGIVQAIVAKKREDVQTQEALVTKKQQELAAAKALLPTVLEEAKNRGLIVDAMAYELDRQEDIASGAQAAATAAWDKLRADQADAAALKAQREEEAAIVELQQQWEQGVLSVGAAFASTLIETQSLAAALAASLSDVIRLLGDAIAKELAVKAAVSAIAGKWGEVAKYVALIAALKVGQGLAQAGAQQVTAGVQARREARSAVTLPATAQPGKAAAVSSRGIGAMGAPTVINHYNIAGSLISEKELDARIQKSVAQAGRRS